MSAIHRVGFIGSGKMATALARGFIQGRAVNAATDISAACPKQDAHLLEDVKKLGCNTFHDNCELVDSSDVVLLAVKPNVIPIVLKQIKPVFKDKLLVSIAAGINIQALEQAMEPNTKVVRVMPNTPCEVREGASVFCLGRATAIEDGEAVKKLFSSVGECHEVNETLIDAVTGISGSGPAYMYLIIEALADGAVKQGLPRPLAYRLAAQTMVGAGRMVLTTDQHPAVLKDEVTSAGGTTISALDILERNGLRYAIMQAVEAATLKSVELSK